MEETTNQNIPDGGVTITLALIRALHRKGILPAQAVAEVLDRRALNAVQRGARSEREDHFQRIAVHMQTIADTIEREHPFVDQTPPPPQA